MQPFQFNCPVDPSTYRALASAMLDEHAALVLDPGFRVRMVNDGITVKTRPLSAWRAGDGAPVETTKMLTHTTFEVAASRERAFGLVGDPTRGAEWDPLDRGHASSLPVRTRWTSHPP